MALRSGDRRRRTPDRCPAAFNGAFKLSTGSGGFESYGRAGASLRAGLGLDRHLFRDGTTDIGAWEQGVPAASKKVIAVRQNLESLISHGNSPLDLGCLTCWGATLDGVVALSGPRWGSPRMAV